MATLRTDVAIIGAGVAGATAALQCARRGLSALCLDRRPLDEAGARWANSVPAWCFDAAELARPRAPELMSEGGCFHMLAGYGPERLMVEEHGLLEVDMRRLVGRIQWLARMAGARLLGRVQVHGMQDDSLETSLGSVAADWVVDASGVNGARLLQSPTVDRAHLCVAAQEVRMVADLARARAYFAEHGVAWGETLCFTGVAGGYSVLNVRGDGEHLSILTGSIPGLGYPSGRKIMARFVNAHPWIGDRLFGGSFAIPLRRPFDRLAYGKLAAVGDAACQVFAAHGSGVGAGMIAGRVLADALASGRGTQGYAVQWHRQYGGMFAAYDLFRRFSEDVSVHQLARMIDGGLMSPELAAQGLEQRLPAITAATMADRLGGALRVPTMSARLGPVVAKMALVQLLYRRYPEDPQELPGWSRRVAALFNDAPDLAREAHLR